MRLPTAAYVVLGMLRLGARSGYEIKRGVEMSTRFFWTISHAQIYPSLKRLERAGLIRGRSDPRGKRRRRLYEVTGEGETALREWLRRDEPLGFELRDLGTLKLFFADALSPEEALEILRAMRGRSERVLEWLRQESEPAALELQSRFPHLTLRMGMALHQAIVDFATTVERELEQAGAQERQAGR